MERKSFLIYKNWADAINALPDEYQLEAYKALISYGVSGEIPKDTSQIVGALLISFSVGMENNILSYEKRVANGKKGGNPNFQKGKPNPYYVKNATEVGEEKLNKKEKSVSEERFEERKEEDDFEKEVERENLANYNKIYERSGGLEPVQNFVSFANFKKSKEDLDEYFDAYMKDFTDNLDDFEKEALAEEKKDNQRKPKDNQDITKDNLNDNDNNNDNENRNDNENDNDNDNTDNLLSQAKIESRSERVLFYLDCLNDKLDNVFNNKDLELDEQVYYYYKDLFYKMSFEKSLKLGSMSLEVDDGIKEYLDVFRQGDKEIVKLLYECYDAIFVKKDVKNRFKYAVSVIYNRMKGL